MFPDDTEKTPKKDISLINKWNDQMWWIEQTTGFRGIYVILILIISLLLVYLNIFDSWITNLVGTLYPAFWTMKAIKNQSDEEKQWWTYWVVFAAFSIIDMFSIFIVKFVPFYFWIKIIFLIWLFMPNSHGATIVYNFLVFFVFKRIENDWDKAADKVKQYTNELIMNCNSAGNKEETLKNIKKTFGEKQGGENGTRAEAKTKNNWSGIIKEESDLLNEEDVVLTEKGGECNNTKDDSKSKMNMTCIEDKEGKEGKEKKNKVKVVNVEKGKQERPDNKYKQWKQTMTTAEKTNQGTAKSVTMIRKKTKAEDKENSRYMQSEKDE